MSKAAIADRNCDSQSSRTPRGGCMSKELVKSILLFGAPGAGKGTVGRTLDTVIGLVHLSSGELFRGLDPETDLAIEIASYIDRGELAPDDLTVRLYRHWVEQMVITGKLVFERDTLILDGIPRNPAQVEILKQDVDVRLLINFKFRPEDEHILIERMKRRALQENRADDADERVIRHRFEVYHRETASVVDQYPRDLIFEVDPLRPPMEVLQAVLGAINQVTAPAKFRTTNRAS